MHPFKVFQIRFTDETTWCFRFNQPKEGLESSTLSLLFYCFCLVEPDNQVLITPGFRLAGRLYEQIHRLQRHLKLWTEIR